MLNIVKGRKNNRKIKFYINSKRSLAYVLVQKPLILYIEEQSRICPSWAYSFVFQWGA